MWQSLFFDLFSGLCQSSKDLTETVVLAVHLLNVSRGLQCTGLSENDPTGHEILPKAWNSNQQLFSFRYSAGELLVFQKFLRINEEKLNVYTIRSDQNDRIINFSADLSSINCQLQGEEFTKELIEKVLNIYENEVLTTLDLSQSEKRLQNEEEEESKNLSSLTKQKSLQDDESVPFGQPINHPQLDAKGFHSGDPFLGSKGVHQPQHHSYFNHPYQAISPLNPFHPHPYYSHAYPPPYGFHPFPPAHAFPSPFIPFPENQFKKPVKKNKQAENFYLPYATTYPPPYYPGFF